MVVVKLNRTRLSHSIPLLSFYTPEIVNALMNSWCICSKLTTKSPEWHHLTSFLVTSLHKKMKFTQFSEKSLLKKSLVENFIFCVVVYHNFKYIQYNINNINLVIFVYEFEHVVDVWSAYHRYSKNWQFFILFWWALFSKMAEAATGGVP